MTELDWDRFKELPGDTTRNFELLCRGAIRRNYASKGDFQSVAQQPGVEFHLRLTANCDELGEPPRWWGWQCRWYGLDAGKQIGSTRRKKIVEAIRTTEKWLPDLTDWVLWTRRPLTPTDQKWFHELESTMILHLRDGSDLPDLLGGDAATLRAAYFGQLVLTPEHLSKMRAEGVEAVKRRYNPEVHVKVEAEKVLEGVLGQPKSWGSLAIRATRLRQKAAQFRADQKLLDKTDPLSTVVSCLLDDATVVEARLRSVVKLLAERGPQHAAALAAAPTGQSLGRREAVRAMATLRTRRQPAALGMHMLDAELRRARALLAGFASRVSISMCAVVGEAGLGKSNLVIDLTIGSADTPAGVYLQGRNLPKNGSLEDLLAPLISRPAGTFKELLEALDAAGARSACRLPLVIDGLNEAENPARFKALLSSLKVASEEFPNVLVVLTLRASAYDYAMPDAAPPCIELTGFGDELDAAIARYFRHYKINGGEVRLPRRLFRQPLLLWMFCEVANPDHAENRKTVQLTTLPATPIAVYERFRDESVRRIATELLSCAEQDVAEGIDRVALELWKRSVRELPFPEVRDLVDREPGWDKSIARALEDEGVLMREPAPSYPEQPSGILFDAFAGFLIADTIVRNIGVGGIDAWLAKKATLAILDPTPGKGHPLASDILTALAGVLPLRGHRQLWPFLDGPRREQALVDATDLESGRLDSDTVDALVGILRTGSTRTFGQIMGRLSEVRSDPQHRLNANFVERVLRTFDVAERDLRWSEWIHTADASVWPRRPGAVYHDVESASRQWREHTSRDESDRLRAVWISWLLTSTDRRLRDYATKALYRYGRGDPASLFSMTRSSLDINDPYVSERLLAASYGVVMANQRPVDLGFEDAYRDYLRELGTAMCGENATCPTSHHLSRTYSSGSWEMAQALYPEIANDVGNYWAKSFASTPAPRGYSETSRRGQEIQHAFRMDFENYTIGGLYEDRSNYNRTHLGYLAGLAHIRGRIWQLGWRQASFERIDKQLGEEQWRGGREDRSDRVDRYGKKYGWVAYYELAGRLDDARGLSNDVTKHIVDIDPSFPEKPPPLPVSVQRWARPTPARLPDWVRHGVINVPDALLVPNSLEGDEGPWVAVDASLRDANELAGRSVWGGIQALLTTSSVAARLSASVAQLRAWSDIRWPEAPSDYYTMAGETPWSPKFAASVLRYDPVPYRSELRLPAVGDFDAEVVAHTYSWEGYHSTTNQLGGFTVPSRTLSRAMGLTKSPDDLDYVNRDGERVARVFSAPKNFASGHLLYVRRDVLETYARRQGSEVVLVVRGTRHPDYELVSGQPRWYTNIGRTRADEWAIVRRLIEFT